MKKLFTLGLAAMMASGLGFAQEIEPSVKIMEPTIMGMALYGYMPVCMSPNGQYVAGSTYFYPMFIWDTESGKHTIYTEQDGYSYEDAGALVVEINDEGLGVGYDDLGNFYIDYTTDQCTRIQISDEALGIRDILVDDATKDGTFLVGMAYMTNGRYEAMYVEDGQVHLLPVPTEEEFGVHYNGARATLVSADKSVILGYIEDRLHTLPMVLWYRQDDGSYKLDPVYEKYWWDKEKMTVSKPYQRFMAYAMNSNATKVVMQLKATSPDDRTPTPINLGIYDIASGEITVIPNAGGVEVYWHGISDNGTIVGYTITQTGQTSVIIYPDDLKPIPFTEAFPTLDELDKFENGYSGGGGEYRVSAISPDGRYITGMFWYDDAVWDTGYYLPFLLDTGTTGNAHQPSGVQAVQTAPDATPVEYFTTTGQRLNAPVKGINIVRMSDGTTKKVIF